MLARLLPCLAALAAAGPAQGPVVFDSGPVHPARVAADGSRLFVADTLGGRLCVFDLRDPSAPFLWAEIPVGLEPVSVHPRTRDEVWVADLLSDSVSIVDVAAGRAVATLPVGDEPSDVVFAGGKAFVSMATADRVAVFDATTRQPLGTVPVFGKDPRALAASPDGSRVYAVVQRSGNGTTVLPADQAPLPPLPWVPWLRPAPAQGLIVRADDPAYAAGIPYTLPDHDVVEIDVANLVVTRSFAAVGTTNTGIAVDAATGDLWVANTDARNLVRFEPALRGHAIDSRLTRITTGPVPTVTPFDLNPGIAYLQLPDPAALATALAEPFGVAIDAAAGLVYVAAHGTDRIGVVDRNGVVLACIEIGGTPGALVNTRHKRGPRGLALHPTASRLYVYNRLSDTLAVVDTGTRTVLGELPIATVDPLTPAQREGRKFLYDSKLAGNGTMSCAACHVDGDTDGLAWDLGDPAGTMQPPSWSPSPFHPLLRAFHPMKGPMTTQTLRGLRGTGRLHWRGDRDDFAAFDVAFDTLLGGTTLPAADMADLDAFVQALPLPPNPNQQLDRSWRTLPVHANEATGAAVFQTNIAPPGGGTISCSACHALPLGTNGDLINAETLGEPQQIKVPQLRTLYRKLGFQRAPGPQKSGFGFLHDGSLDTLAAVLAQPPLAGWPPSVRDDLIAFLLSFDTGTAPAVGHLALLDAGTAATTAPVALQLLTTRAAAGDLDLVAHGRVDGRLAALRYERTTGLFVGDRTGDPTRSGPQLLAQALAGTVAVVLSGVPPRGGERALDRDGDGAPDGDEAAAAYGPPTPGCAGPPRLAANSEPRRGNSAFGFVAGGAGADTAGVLLLSPAPAAFAALGVQVLVDPATAMLLPLATDAFGDAVAPLPIPTNPAYIGLTVHAQVLWLDACGTQALAATAGLAFAVRP